jgi:hypothetical protein
MNIHLFNFSKNLQESFHDHKKGGGLLYYSEKARVNKKLQINLPKKKKNHMATLTTYLFPGNQNSLVTFHFPHTNMAMKNQKPNSFRT